MRIKVLALGFQVVPVFLTKQVLVQNVGVFLVKISKNFLVNLLVGEIGLILGDLRKSFIEFVTNSLNFRWFFKSNFFLLLLKHIVERFREIKILIKLS